MKKYIPYIAIPLIIYLIMGFIKMQFNPAYWGQDARIQVVGFTFCVMLVYPIAKYMINDIKQS